MKMIGRWTFAIAAAISLLLCVATLAMWVRTVSTVHYDAIAYKSCEASFYREGVVCLTMPDPLGDDGWRYERRSEFGSARIAYERLEAITDKGFNFFGFAWFQRTQPGPVFPPFQVLIVPYWMIIVATAILPLIWLIVWRRRRTQQRA